MPPVSVSVVPGAVLTLAFCERTSGAEIVWLPRVTLRVGVAVPSASVIVLGPLTV